MKELSISLIIPVYEEEYDVASNIDALVGKLNELGVQDYELLVFLSAKRYSTFPKFLVVNKKIKFIDHCGCSELGGIFRRGIKLAKKEFVGLFPPYNQVSVNSLRDIFKALSFCDMAVAYIGNRKARPCYRAIASVVNTCLVNVLFGLNFKYYHLDFYKTGLAQRVKITTDSHAAMIEVAVWLAKSGTKFIQVPFTMTPHSFKSKSRAFRTKNVKEILKTYFSLFWQVTVLRKRISLN